MKFILNALGSLQQDEVDVWIAEEVELAPLMEPALRNLAAHRDTVLRELYQITPAEIFDVWRSEHPEILFPEQNVVLMRIGQELQAITELMISMGGAKEAGEAQVTEGK